MNEPFVKSVRMRCSKAHAFATFTHKIDLWWPRSHRKFENSKLSLQPHEGGLFIEHAVSGEAVEFGRVTHCDPPHEISLTWNPGKITHPTDVTISFVTDGDGTLVKVVHREGQSELGEHWNDRVVLFTKGWNAVFEALTTQCEVISDNKAID